MDAWHCLLRVVFSLFCNNWSTRVGAFVVIDHNVIPLAVPMSDKYVVTFL